MKAAKFETYRPVKDEFKMAKSKIPLSLNKPYVPKPHPQAQRLSEALKK
jgi:hypothetical protein